MKKIIMITLKSLKIMNTATKDNEYIKRKILKDCK